MNGRADYFDLAISSPEMFANPPGAAFEILLDDEAIDQAEARMAEILTEYGMPAEGSKVGVAFTDQYLTILRDGVRFVDGTLGTYIRMVSVDPTDIGVVVLPVWRGQILLIRHFRHATRSWHLEIPRGSGSSERPEESAIRELTEEIGASGVTLTDLGEMYPDTGAGNGRVSLFYAEVTSYGQPESNEGITDVMPTPIPRFEEMIAVSDLDDGFLLAAFARAKARNLI